jgi:hypothetical protein
MEMTALRDGPRDERGAKDVPRDERDVSTVHMVPRDVKDSVREDILRKVPGMACRGQIRAPNLQNIPKTDGSPGSSERFSSPSRVLFRWSCFGDTEMMLFYFLLSN